MLIKCFLTINSVGAVRVTKGSPNLNFDEITIGLNLELPNALFKKPQLSAMLVIPESVAIPSVLPVEVISSIGEAIRLASGMEVKLSVIGEE